MTKPCWITLDKEAPPDVLLKLSGRDVPGLDIDEADARKAIDVLRDQLIELQERLYAEGRHKVLVVLQAMDTGGKDGAIRRVFSGVNPLGSRWRGSSGQRRSNWTMTTCGRPSSRSPPSTPCRSSSSGSAASTRR
jgi:hypothetical protein